MELRKLFHFIPDPLTTFDNRFVGLSTEISSFSHTNLECLYLFILCRWSNRDKMNWSWQWWWVKWAWKQQKFSMFLRKPSSFPYLISLSETFHVSPSAAHFSTSTTTSSKNLIKCRIWFYNFHDSLFFFDYRLDFDSNSVDINDDVLWWCKNFFPLISHSNYIEHSIPFIPALLCASDPRRKTLCGFGTRRVEKIRKKFFMLPRQTTTNRNHQISDRIAVVRRFW